jgi:hypothetical protein
MPVLIGSSKINKSNQDDLIMEYLKLSNKAFKLFPGSKKQKEVIDKISDLRKLIDFDYFEKKFSKVGNDKRRKIGETDTQKEFRFLEAAGLLIGGISLVIAFRRYYLTVKK